MDNAKQLSGTLPILHINIWESDGVSFNNELLDRNLSHKEYFHGEYWLDTNGCSWLEDSGAYSIGSAESPLELEIKARGNYTRIAFSKKPFKIKLGKKQKMLGMSKNKHFALLPHADDDLGYLRDYVGFNLGKRIGLSWTPSQQPVELVVNGDYRGLYFLTESIRVDEERINIQELADNEENPELISGGYLVELDNYTEDNQLTFSEKSFVNPDKNALIRVTWTSPEEYSDIQKRFVTDQFLQMNDYIGSNCDSIWSYLDLDDAVRYYLVQELMRNTESYQGSTFLYRDAGEGQKWHFGPLWDFGNSFTWGSDGTFLYNNTRFSNCWIPSLRCNDKFNLKVYDTWAWFMTMKYEGLEEDIVEYIDCIKTAAENDYQRWKSETIPDHEKGRDIVDNSDMEARRDQMLENLEDRIAWLKGQFGDFVSCPNREEPKRDTTPAASLPDYASSQNPDGVDLLTEALQEGREIYYNLQGIPVKAPVKNHIYIRINGKSTEKIRY
ncbi:MAG: CotH kinase family protein [Muribaculaceae bacterium]|nr:CotH kinase family protein [Muribaculaceae bacterium]